MNILESKMQKKNTTFQGDMAKFIKRRRVELGLKLEDLSEGICSVSYLSRIENNLVEVEDCYYQLLCEKMNMNYENVKKDRSKNIYSELLKEYISDNIDSMDKIIKHAIESKSYVDTELELILLLDNITKGLFDEARKILIKIERLSEQLSNNELLFYMYCYTLYTHKTNQNKRAYKNMLILLNVIYDDTFFEACVYDLALDVMSATNNHVLWWKCYHRFEQLINGVLFRNRLIIHKLQMYEIDSHINLEHTLEDVEELMNHFELDNYTKNENYCYYLSKIYFNNKQYDKAVEVAMKVNPSARLTSIIVSCLYRLHNLELVNNILSILNNVQFSKYEIIYQNYYYFIKLMMEGNNNYVLYNYYRTVLINEDEFFDGFIEKEKEKLLIDIIIGCSKYKEGVKYWKKTSEVTLHEKLK